MKLTVVFLIKTALEDMHAVDLILGLRVLPAFTKPGVCPINNLEVVVDCPNDEKCCHNGCGHQCMPPYAGICY
uniref:WAP domain-containing protein n=1 Tax=Sinocyclocheilus rhinocerous TaxID=307959 RepID=A0A673HUW7_9TELE